MLKNEIYEIEITGMTDDGDGVGRAESMAVFVPYTIVGETVRVVIVKVLKNYAFGKLLEVIKPSIHRVKADCPHFYQCGGCQLRHMDDEAELEYKRQKVQDCISRIGGLDVTVEPVLNPSENIRYRNKSQFPVTPKGIGFYRRNSHDVIPMEDCLIQGEYSKQLISVLKNWMEKYNISAYDEKNNNGIVRHLYTRDGKEGILVVIVATKDKLPKQQELVDEILKTGLPVAGIVLNVNNKRTNVVLGNKNITIYGKQSLRDSIGRVSFDISPLSFYQVNPKGTLCLYQTAKDLADLKGNEILWDLYCGIGTIGQFFADKVKEIDGVEIVPEAVEDAEKNAILNGIENAEYYCAKAEEIAQKLVKEKSRPNVVVLDPPRKGCEESLLETVTEVQPEKIVYISCKPSTLARDLKYLNQKGYSVKRVIPVHMFPKSSHVETVALLTK